MNVISQAFVGNRSRSEIDYEKSSFSYSQYQMIAGRRIIVRVNLLDNVSLSIINVTGNNSLILRNLTVHLISTNPRNQNEY
jgi:hypothetical protein